MKHFHNKGNYQKKTLCRKTGLAEAALQQTVPGVRLSIADFDSYSKNDKHLAYI